MEIIINETGEQVELRIYDDNDIDYFAELASGDRCLVWDAEEEVYRADADTVQWWRDRINDIYAVETRADEIAYNLDTTKHRVMVCIEEAMLDLDEYYKASAIELLDNLTEDDLID